MTDPSVLSSLAKLRQHRRTGRVSSWDRSGRNADMWILAPGETRVLADLRGPGQITHIWFAQPTHFREVLLRITWDDAPAPSVVCPVGDFFGLGNGITNSYQSALFSASTPHLNRMGDMIWVDGYKWPPDLHGTGSEDYFNQAWGMQPNAFWRNGSSVFEGHTGAPPGGGGYQTSYVFHLENPIYFRREIKVTIEAGHGNHLRNDISSVAYWYAARPAVIQPPPPVRQRRPIFRDANGAWSIDAASRCPGPQVTLTPAILKASPAVADALRPAVQTQIKACK